SSGCAAAPPTAVDPARPAPVRARSSPRAVHGPALRDRFAPDPRSSRSPRSVSRPRRRGAARALLRTRTAGHGPAWREHMHRSDRRPPAVAALLHMKVERLVERLRTSGIALISTDA